MATTSTLGELLIKIGVDVSDVREKLGDVEKRLTSLSEKAGSGGDGFSRFGARIVTLNNALELGAKAVEIFRAGFEHVSDFIGEAVKESEAHESAVKKLNAALESSVQFTTADSQALQELASQLAAVTTATGDTIIGFEQMLVQMGIGPDRIKAVTRAVLDLQAAGVDADSAIRAFGKAAEGEFSAFQRLGVSIEGAEKNAKDLGNSLEAIKGQFGGDVATEAQNYAKAVLDVERGYGDTAGAAKRLDANLKAIKARFNSEAADAVERYANRSAKLALALKAAESPSQRLDLALKGVNARFGGQAQAEADTFAGKVIAVGKSFGEFQQRVGDVITQSPGLRAVLVGLSEGLDGLTRRFEESGPKFTAFIDEGVAAASAKLAELAGGLKDIFADAGLDGLAQGLGEVQRILGEAAGNAAQIVEPIVRVGAIFTNTEEKATAITRELGNWGAEAKAQIPVIAGVFTDIEGKAKIPLSFTPDAQEKLVLALSKVLGVLAEKAGEIGVRVGAAFIEGFIKGVISSVTAKDFLPNIGRAAGENFTKQFDEQVKLEAQKRQQFTGILDGISELIAKAQEKLGTFFENVNRQALEIRIRDLEVALKGGADVSAELNKLKQELEALPARKDVSLNATSEGVSGGVQTALASLALLPSDIRIPTHVDLAGFNSDVGLVRASLLQLASTSVNIPVNLLFTSAGGGGAGGLPGAAAAAGTKAGTQAAAAFVPSFSDRVRDATINLGGSQIEASLNSGMASILADLGHQSVTIDANLNVQASGSPTLPFTTYFDVYAPSVIKRFQDKIADSELTIFTTAFDVLRKGADVTVSEIESAIKGLEEIGSRFGPEIRSQLLTGTAASPLGGGIAGAELLAARQLIPLLQDQLRFADRQVVTTQEVGGETNATLRRMEGILGSMLTSGPGLFPGDPDANATAINRSLGEVQELLRSNVAATHELGRALTSGRFAQTVQANMERNVKAQTGNRSFRLGG